LEERERKKRKNKKEIKKNWTRVKDHNILTMKRKSWCHSPIPSFCLREWDVLSYISSFNRIPSSERNGNFSLLFSSSSSFSSHFSSFWFLLSSIHTIHSVLLILPLSHLKEKIGKNCFNFFIIICGKRFWPFQELTRDKYLYIFKWKTIRFSNCQKQDSHEIKKFSECPNRGRYGRFLSWAIVKPDFYAVSKQSKVYLLIYLFIE
jgi:hypothetical protein